MAKNPGLFLLTSKPYQIHIFLILDREIRFFLIHISGFSFYTRRIRARPPPPFFAIFWQTAYARQWSCQN